eukprot:UN05630
MNNMNNNDTDSTLSIATINNDSDSTINNVNINICETVKVKSVNANEINSNICTEQLANYGKAANANNKVFKLEFAETSQVLKVLSEITMNNNQIQREKYRIKIESDYCKGLQHKHVQHKQTKHMDVIVLDCDDTNIAKKTHMTRAATRKKHQKHMSGNKRHGSINYKTPPNKR